MRSRCAWVSSTALISRERNFARASVNVKSVKVIYSPIRWSNRQGESRDEYSTVTHGLSRAGFVELSNVPCVMNCQAGKTVLDLILPRCHFSGVTVLTGGF